MKSKQDQYERDYRIWIAVEEFALALAQKARTTARKRLKQARAEWEKDNV